MNLLYLFERLQILSRNGRNVRVIHSGAASVFTAERLADKGQDKQNHKGFHF